MNYKTPVLLVAAFLVTACAAPMKVNDHYDMPADALEDLRQLKIISEQELLDEGFIEIGLVSGSSCRKGSDSDMLKKDSATYRFVLSQMQMSAAEKGAELITTPHCIIRDAEESSRYCMAAIDCTSRIAVTTGTPEIRPLRRSAL